MASKLPDTDDDDDEVFKKPVGRPKPRKPLRQSAIDVAMYQGNGDTGTSDSHLTAEHHGSISNLLQTNSGSSRTLNIPQVTKTLSASNLAALSDSNLSIQEALPHRSYDAPNTVNYHRKQLFEQSVRQYYYQMLEGCDDPECQNKFCASSKVSSISHISPERALLVAVELTVSQKEFVCMKERCQQRPVDRERLTPRQKDRSPRAFLSSLFTRTPFSTLFRRPDPTPNTARGSFQGYVDEEILLANKPSIHKSRLGSVSLTPSLENLTLCGANGEKVKSGRRGSVTSEPGDDDDDVISTSRRRKLCRQVSSSLSNLPAAMTELERFGNKTPPMRPLSETDSMHADAYCFNNVYNYTLGHQLQVPSLGGSQLSLDASSAYSDSVQYEYSDMEDADHHQEFDQIYQQPAEFSLTHLTVPMLQCALEKFSETGDSSFILNTIRTVFTSSEAMNNSFKKDESKPSGGSNLDLKAVRKAYELLTGQDQFVSRLNNSIEILLTCLSTQSILPHDISQLAILLECPLFRRRRNHGLRQRYCSVLATLSPASRVALSEVWINYEQRLFEKRMGIFHDHFMLSLRPKQRLDENNRAMAEALSIFYQTNCLAEERRGAPIVSHSLFYVSDLGRKLDFKSEYEAWAKDGSGESPVGSLLNYPFLLDAASKVHALHLDAVTQMRSFYMEAILHQARVIQVQRYLKEINRSVSLPNAIKSAVCPYLVLDIRRDHTIGDAISQLRLKQHDIKKPLKIKYVGGGEVGFDMGGPQKEFFQLACAEIFDPDNGMFAYCDESRNLWINGASNVNDDKFEFVGTLLGLAIYNGIILDVRFPPAIYKKLQGLPVGLQDLQNVEPTIYRSYQELLSCQEEVEDVYLLTFQISSMVYGEVVTKDLIPGGSTVLVNNENRVEFVNAAVDYYLTTSIAKQFTAFKSGFQKVCDNRSLGLFRPDEIELLVCGSPLLDFGALEKHASYDEGFHREHRVIRWFWTIVHAYDQDQKRQLLKFVTGSDRVPVKGLSQLPILIQRNGEDSDRLPTAMTCFNRLLLPDYATHARTEERLAVAISNAEGFGLT